MSFDTTAVNTGLRNGACILLEQDMDKDMLCLACHHLIMEIMLEAVVVHAIGCSSGPDILLFKRFKKSWNTIQSEHFETVISDASTLNEIENISTDTIIFASKQLEEFQPRDDHKELLNLYVLFTWGEFLKSIYVAATYIDLRGDSFKYLLSTLSLLQKVIIVVDEHFAGSLRATLLRSSKLSIIITN